MMRHISLRIDDPLMLNPPVNKKKKYFREMVSVLMLLYSVRRLLMIRLTMLLSEK